MEGGQGWGNNRWLWYMGSCPGWKHHSHPLPSSETPDPGTQSSGSSYGRINRALIHGQSCLCQEGAPPSPSTQILVGTSSRGDSNVTIWVQRGLPSSQQELPAHGRAMFAQV